ncbi:MAG: hypothetical protein GX883_00525, partial [Firmicutes bacterium]|nr:hypothetical protein [Bacillota bacterium]
MEWLAKAINWVVTRYRTHPGRFLLITFAAVALVTTGILWACGLFSTFSYLPNRAYIAAESEAPEPQTLAELLHSAVPDVDILLQKPALAQELLSTESLIEIADSRLALNNLRTLDEELGKRLAELVPAEEEPSETPEDEAPAEEEPSETPTDEAPAEEEAPAAEQKSTVAPPPYNLENIAPYRSASELEITQQLDELTALKEKTGKLLTPPSYGEPVSLPQAVNLKGVWQAPGETLLHMTPSGDWLPEEGYRLFRVIDGKKELIAEQAASPANALSGKLAIAHADLIKDLYGEAALTPKKLETMGMTAAAFREMAYLTDTLEEKPLVSGALDFKEMQKALITIPAEIEQKIPETDQMLSRPIYLPGQQNRSYANAAVGASLWKKLTVIQEELDFEINPLLLETLTARHKLTTMSFVDDEFAEEAGFLFRDDLSAVDLPTGTPISYLVEAPDGIKAELAITPGVENKPSKPQGLVGYGLDGKVPLRWGEVESEAEQDILSGYFIERKLDGEKEFVQINEEPVVVSYMLDETEIYFESPIFYEDEVADGRTAQYRLRSLDIFGRTSEYSDVLSIKVEKVSPPNAPTIATPALSLPGTEAAGEQSEAVKQSLALNKNKRGIVLPIHTDSPDTVRFTIYRAAAEGAKGFGTPTAIANLTYEHPAASGELNLSADEIPAFKVRRVNRARHHFLSSIHPSEPNLVYFDSKIKEGYTYKYWVSAWDSWNNESVWSQSAASGVPTDAVPKAPGELEIAMLSRELPDLSELPPGVRNDGPVSYDSLKKLADGPMRQYETDITTIEKADSLDLRIGQFLAGSHLPVEISSHYDNLPGDKYIHMFVAVRGEEVLPNGTARLKWPHYSGEGLSGYVLYAPCFPLASLEEMQQMSRAELTEMGPWQRLNDEAIAENQFVAGGLSQTPGELSLFLVCLEPKSDLRPGDLQFQLSSGASLTKLSKSLSIDKQRLANMIALGDEIQTPESGYVKLDWKASDNPQVKYYRVYRFEVPSFKEGPPEPPSKFLQMWVRIKSFFTFWVKSEEPAKEPAQEWTLVGDNIIAPTYTERVEQSFAHYYYYKVTA